jgi:hypothetical protein
MDKPTPEQISGWLSAALNERTGLDDPESVARLLTLAYQAGAADAIAKLRGDVELPEGEYVDVNGDQRSNAFTKEQMLDYGDRRAAAAVPQGNCTWTQSPDFDMGDTYESQCGETWSFIDGGPTENRVRFCQGCGKPVVLAPRGQT